MEGKRSRRETKTETMRKGEVENRKEKSAKTAENREDDQWDRPRTAFNQIERLQKSNCAGRNFDEQTKRHNKSNSAQKMKGEKTAETRERRIS